MKNRESVGYADRCSEPGLAGYQAHESLSGEWAGATHSFGPDAQTWALLTPGSLWYLLSSGN